MLFAITRHLKGPCQTFRQALELFPPGDKVRSMLSDREYDQVQLDILINWFMLLTATEDTCMESPSPLAAKLLSQVGVWFHNILGGRLFGSCNMSHACLSVSFSWFQTDRR